MHCKRNFNRNFSRSQFSMQIWSKEQMQNCEIMWVSKCVCVICLGLENDTIDDKDNDDDDDDAFCAKFMRFIAILFEL